jgi:hypothetical protein
MPQLQLWQHKVTGTHWIVLLHEGAVAKVAGPFEQRQLVAIQRDGLTGMTLAWHRPGIAAVLEQRRDEYAVVWPVE